LITRSCPVIGVNAAGVTGVRTPPIFDLQGSMKALDPGYRVLVYLHEGREGKGTTKEKDPLNTLSELTPMCPVTILERRQ